MEIIEVSAWREFLRVAYNDLYEFRHFDKYVKHTLLTNLCCELHNTVISLDYRWKSEVYVQD